MDTEDSLLDQFKNNVEFQKGNYTVSLPWKDSTVTLPDNYQLSLKRLHGLSRAT